MRTPRGNLPFMQGADYGAGQQKGPSASRILMYIIGILIVGMILLNFLPAVGISGCVGVIDVVGEISTTSGYGVQSSGEISDLLQKASDRPDIRAVVLVVNSPGGSAVAANEIYQSLNSINKPTVAYISDMGASAGYYAALGADKIYADPASLTGSIGVRSVTIFDISRLLTNNGINTTTIKSGEMKDMADLYRPMTANETKLMQSIVDEMANEFRNVTNDARAGKNDRYSLASLEKVADARVLTGKQAYALGLVDELGTRKDAINYAAAAVGMDPNPQLCILRVEKDFLTSMFSSMGHGIGEALSQNLLSSQQTKIT